MTTEILTLQRNEAFAPDYQALINQKQYDIKCIWVTKRIAEVAAFALGVIMVVASACLGVLYLPLGVAGAANLIPKLHKNFYDPYMKQEEEAQTYINNSRGILSKMEQYRNADDQEIMYKLLEMGVFPVSIEHQNELNGLTDLIPLIAQYDHWVSLSSKTSAFIKSKKEEINRLLMFDPSPKAQRVSEAKLLQNEVYLQEEKKLLPQKLKAAFMLNVISNVTDQRKADDYGELAQRSTGERYLLNQVGENPGFVLNDGTTINRDFFLRAKVSEVAKRIFHPKAL